MVGGMRSSNKIQVVIGLLSLMSGISTATGEPIPLLISTVLSVVRTVLSSIDKGKPKESQEDMIKREVRDALVECREENLDAEWLGYQQSYELLKANMLCLRGIINLLI
jgi:hypothetical protein